MREVVLASTDLARESTSAHAVLMANSNTTSYEVLMAYSDDPIRWDAPITMISVLGQGKEGDRLLIETTDPAALEAAMDADDRVISYDVSADESEGRS